MPLFFGKQLAAYRTADGERRMFCRGLVDLWHAVDLYQRTGDDSDLRETMGEVREVLVRFVEEPQEQTPDPDKYFR
jgi:hypothetical protein